MNRTSIILAVMLAAAMSISGVYAQTYGGLNPGAGLTPPGGGYTTVTPRFGGGYNVWNSDGSYSNITPRFGGGYNVWNSDGSYQNITPRFGGGYNIWSSGR